MLSACDRIKLQELLSAGLSAPKIAKLSGRSTATIYKYRKLYHSKKPRVTATAQLHVHKILSSYKKYIDARIRSGIVNSFKLYREIQLKGYCGSYYLVNKYVKAKALASAGHKRSIQVVTAPGEQAQVDWGSFGRIDIRGSEERLYAFVYVLSYSRAMYVEFVIRQNQQTFHGCHIHAFEKLGIPKKIAYDNIKTVVLARKRLPDGSYKNTYNTQFLDFAGYYGFKPYLCPPYWPRSKGKVEAGVKYVRRNFMEGAAFKKRFKTLEELNRKVRRWTGEIAQQRIHGTTKEKPHDLWLDEKNFLSFRSDLPPYSNTTFVARYSSLDAVVQFEGCYYSVPTEFARKKLLVRRLSKHGLPVLEIYYQDEKIAEHQMVHKRGKWVFDDKHLLDQSGKHRKKIVRSSKNRNSKKDAWQVPVRDLSEYNLLVPYFSSQIHGKKES